MRAVRSASSPKRPGTAARVLGAGPWLRGSLYAFFLERAGFDVEVAADGETALRTAVEKRFDVIVLDLGLPRLSGFDVMHRLKSDERTRQVPIIVGTGYATPRVADVLRASGAAYVCVKPCSPEQLEEAIRHVLT